jgi:uncharacterized protein
MSASAPRSPAVVDPALPADATRERLAIELRAAMKARDGVAVAVVRSLLSAIDNASAVPMTKSQYPGDGAPSEVARRELTAAEVDQVLAVEAEERRLAAEDYERRGLQKQADTLRQTIRIISRLTR